MSTNVFTSANTNYIDGDTATFTETATGDSEILEKYYPPKAGINIHLKKEANGSDMLFLLPLIQIQKPKSTFGCIVGFVFTAVFVGILFIANSIPQESIVPNEIDELIINDIASFRLSIEEAIFFRVQVPEASLIAISTDFVRNFVDTTLTLIRPPNEIVAFNDDISELDFNALLVFFSEKSEELVIRVESIGGFDIGRVELIFEVIETKLLVGEPIEAVVPDDEFQLYTLEGLEVGETYEITGIDASLGQTSFFTDSILKVRDLDGNEVITALKSSASEFTARLLLTPPDDRIYVLEVRSFEITDVLLRLEQIVPLELDLSEEIEPQILLLNTQEASFVEFEVQANIKYDISFLVNVVFDEIDYNFFGYTASISTPYYYVFTDFFTRRPIPGISIRAYDIDKNEVFERSRSQVVETERFGNDGNYYVSFDAPSDNITRLSLLSETPRRIVLDISRWHLDYTGDGSENVDFAFVEMSIVQERVRSITNKFVDPADIYPACDIDPAKHTIDDDSCERGIVLYCRHEIFPAFDISKALKSDFQKVCECATFLCSTLPSGDDLNKALFSVKNVFAGVFASQSLLAMIIFVALHTEIFMNGGFNYWVYKGAESSTWFRNFLFFLCAFVFFITEFMLNSQVPIMENISEKTPIETNLDSTSGIRYSYYINILTEFVGGIPVGINPYINSTLLEPAAIAELEKGISLQLLFALVNVNLLYALFKDFLAIVVYLDVSVHWYSISSTNMLNKLQHQRREQKFKGLVRIVEVIFFLFLIVFTVLQVTSNGKSYNIIPNLVILSVSMFVVFLYFLARHRLKKNLFRNDVKLREKEAKLWNLIQKVSTFVMFSNLGVITVQLYLIMEVQDFNDLVEAASDPLTQLILLFQDICNFVGQITIFFYVLKNFLDFRDSLFYTVLE